MSRTSVPFSCCSRLSGGGENNYAVRFRLAPWIRRLSLCRCALPSPLLPASLLLAQGYASSWLSLVQGFGISKPYSTLFFSQYGHAALPYWYLDGCCAASSVCKHQVRCTLFIHTKYKVQSTRPDVDAPTHHALRHRVHPRTRHPRPPDPGSRMPPPQRRRVPARHRTVPRPRAWDARASTVIGATASRPLAPKPSRRKRPAAPHPATAATHSPQPPPRPPPERRRAEPPPHTIQYIPYLYDPACMQGRSRKQGFLYMASVRAPSDSGSKAAASAHGMGSGGLPVDTMSIGLRIDRMSGRGAPW
jgi:hypothetical protein